MGPMDLLAGTADGIKRIHVDENGEPAIVASGLYGQAIRGIAAHPGLPETIFVAAGLRGWGLHVSHDSGMTFQELGFQDYWCWDVAIDPANPDRILLGTEPPMLWESLDRGHSWCDFPGIEQVESRARWTFFHAPFHAGHLHGIALSRDRPNRILVGVEQGGLLRSTDGGTTWTDVMPGADMHRIEIHPENPDRVYAGAGNGLFVSDDGGVSWEAVQALRGRYIHGIVIDPADSRRMFVYVDSQECPLYRSGDSGATWEPAGIGLPSSRPADPLRLHPHEPATLYYTGDRDGGSTLYVSNDDGGAWWSTGMDLPKVWRIQALST